MNLSTFDLNLLRVLDALLREHSTVKAAARVRLSQPAVSAALGRLREALNDPLFVRHGQRLVPTEYAKSLEIPLRRLLDELVELLAGPGEFDPGAGPRNFKIAGSDFFAEMLMPPLASSLGQLSPNIQVQLVALQADNHVGTLEGQGIDLVLVPKEKFPGWVDSQELFRSRFVVVARRGHPVLRKAGVKHGDTIPLDLFCRLGHAVFSPEGKLKAMGDAALSKIGRQRRTVVTMPTFGGVGQAVAESDLIALLPVNLAERMGPRLGLSTFAAPFKLPLAQICMAWHKRNTGNPAHRWLRAEIERVLSPLDDGAQA